MGTFPSTAWTAVSRARSGAGPEAREALAFLCSAYWPPLYGFARRLGYSTEDAHDLTQGYFALLIEKDYLQLPNFFDALDIVLLSVDAATGEALRDGNGDLIKYNVGNTNWVPLMLRNSSFIIHPEEVLADNFATLMEWRSDGVLPPANPDGFPANDVDLLVAMEGVLAGGCKEVHAAPPFQAFR
jgi:hypothetical protein